MFQKAIAVAGKDLRLLLKDKGALAVLFLLPLCFAAIFGSASRFAGGLADGSDSEGAPAITAYLSNEDNGLYGAQVAEALRGVGVLDLITAANAHEADRLVGEGKAPAAIVIPADFTRRIDLGEPTGVRVIIDPTVELAGNIVGGIVNQAIAEVDILGEIKLGIRAVLDETGILDNAAEAVRRAAEAQTLGVIWTQVQKMRLNPLISVKSETLEGEETEGTWNMFSYYAPAFSVMFAFFLVAFMASSLLQEKEQGLFYRLLSSPVHPGAIIAGKILAYSAVVFLQILLLFGVGGIAFDMPFGNSPVGLLVVTVALAFTATSMGTMIGAVAKNSSQAGNLGTLLGFILMAAGGCIFPFFRQGGIIAVVSYITPHAHAVNAYMRLISDGFTLGQVLPHVLALIGYTAVFSTIAMLRLRLT